MKQKNQTLFIEDRLGSSMSRWKPIARPWPGKGPVCPRIETEPQFCSRAGVWVANPPCEPGAHGLNRAFHSPALGAVAIPSWPANHGLCSTRAIEVSSRAFPATSPFLSAIFALGGRPNSLRASSPSPILAAFVRKTVFTHTQTLSQERYFFALAFSAKTAKKIGHQMGKQRKDFGWWSHGRKGIIQDPVVPLVIFHVVPARTARPFPSK